MDYYSGNPADEHPLDDDYYMLFGRLRTDAVEMYIAFTTRGDDEFDRIASQLGLKSFSYVANDAQAAEEWARKDARILHPTLPIEIRYLEDGEVSIPTGMFLLPVNRERARICQTCCRNEDNLEHWRSAGRWGHPVFCSRNCEQKWYEELPFLTTASDSGSFVIATSPREENIK